MAESASQLNQFVNIFTSPSVVFSALKQRPNIISPLALIVLLSVAVMGYYYAVVDYPWMIDQLVAAKSENMSASDQENMHKAFASLPKSVTAGSSIAGVVLCVPIILAVLSTYLLLINKIMDKQSLGFKHWFALACWTSLPLIFTNLASLVNIFLASNGQLAPDAINPFNINSLIFHISSSKAVAAPLTAIDPFTVWTLVLLTLGYRQWTGNSLMSSAIIACAPTVVIYGIWIAVAAL